MKITRIVLLLVVTSIIITQGCKPYPKPEYEEVKNNETAFVIPLEGETGKQMKFASVDYLKSAQVAVKRIQITKRWNKTGRLWFTGDYLPMIRVIKVDRTPVTREWTADEQSGTRQKDDAIWVESQDSIGFSVGFLVTGFIKPEDAAQFLFLYPSGSLAQVLDTEVRTRVQGVAARECAKHRLDDLRNKKNEVSQAVAADVIAFYSDRGITITAVSMFGGFQYENVAIQTAIDNTFVSQQEKVVAQALFDAQQKKNDTITLAADAEAAKIQKVNAALEEASKNPLYLKIKLAEIEQARVTKWDGKYPQWYMSSDIMGSNTNLLLQPPVGGEE